MRTGLPPRVAKRILTHREYLELRLWVQGNPIDDQSNHHIPIASLQSSMVNMMGNKSKVTDFLIFNQDKPQDIEALLKSEFD